MRPRPVPGAGEGRARVELRAVRTVDGHVLHTTGAAAAAEHNPIGIPPDRVQNLGVTHHRRRFRLGASPAQAAEDEHSANDQPGQFSPVVPSAVPSGASGCSDVGGGT